jgi:hypothetical protein
MLYAIFIELTLSIPLWWVLYIVDSRHINDILVISRSYFFCIQRNASIYKLSYYDKFIRKITNVPFHLFISCQNIIYSCALIEE